MSVDPTPADDDERFRELLRAALPLTGPVPPSYQVWAAGQARRSARRHRRVALSAAAAVVVLMALSIPVLNSLDAGPTELVTTGTDIGPTTPSSATTSQPGAEGPQPPMREPETPMVPPVAPLDEAPTSQERFETPLDEDAAPVTTTTVIAAGQRSASDDSTSTISPLPGPPPPFVQPAVSLREAAQEVFAEQFGGVTGFSEDTYVVHVKPGPIALPPTFQGYPVVPAEHTWAELEATLASIEAHEQELRAADVPITRYFINLQTLEVVLTVSRLDPSIEQAVHDIVGVGPWKLQLA